MNVLALITCKSTGLRYVCITKRGRVDPGTGFNPLLYGHGTKFKEAVRTHGSSSFEITILGSGYIARADLYEAERQAIVLYGTIWPNGYNVSLGGTGPDFGEEFRRSVAARNARPGYRAALSVGVRKAYSNPVCKQNLRDAVKASWRKPGARKRRAEIARELWNDPAYVEKQKTGVSTPEYKERHREATRIATLTWWARRKARAAGA